ncbi:hypothetical protein BLA24_00575 [Streptomyces cinnamoneus]|uniref:Integral membrane protein n=1 Tax=Streptomyces cinnamoneus TaxID=53446 RepID=A0A2G1XQJ2_STRCJ|nr:hypothetical protein [Streptomyces cinnamoneus]PHQ53461.1 hypothetical protein BLA24_00575 [Streptomyces cinnamoneus]PPT12766.1 hypothetical protein CYQ11_07585 [Streptomyces cinnamoneus]
MEGTGVRFRTVRAALFTALCVTLSAASHVLLSRAPLPLSTVTVLSGAFFALSYALAGRERGYWPIATLLVPLELSADTVFTTGQHACYGQAGGPVAGPLRSMGVDLVCGGGDFGTPLARMAGPAGSGHMTDGVAGHSATPWLLLAAHVAVGLLAAAWLRRGEVALFRLLRAVASLAFRPLLPLVAALAAHARPARPPVRPVRDTLSARVLPLLVHSVVRRGPPPCPASA